MSAFLTANGKVPRAGQPLPYVSGFLVSFPSSPFIGEFSQFYDDPP